MITRIGLTLALLAPTLPASAQATFAGGPGERIALELDEEIALARSAAPDEVSAAAEILAFDGAGYATAVEGTNGVVCYVGRSWPGALEPHCFDEEGAGTILPIHLEMNRLWIAGASPEEVRSAVAEGIVSGRFRLPERPAVSYMMSAEQVLYDEEGEFVGSWEPHLMIYFPYMTREGVGGMAGVSGVIVSDPGSPLSSMVVVTRDGVPATTRSTGGR